MEGAPVVEIVQVHSAGIDGAVVWKSIGFENGVSRRVCVEVSEDGRVVFIDGCLVELHARLLLDPSFELRVGGFGLNKRTHGGFFEVKGRQHHGVVPLANAGIIVVQLTLSFEGGFLPEPGQVKNANRARKGRADHRYVFHD